MRKAILLLSLQVLALSVAAQSTTFRPGFIYREGIVLMLDGQPYQSVGFTCFQLSGCGHPWELFTPTEVDSLFATLPRNMLLRTWAFAGNDAQTEGVVRAAERHGLKLILALADGRSSCGEFDGAPAGDGSGKTDAWYLEGYKVHYLDHVKSTVQRFRDSEAVGMWEIINEPSVDSLDILCDFMHSMAAFIKQLDPNHLVETGSFAAWAYGGLDGYRRLHDSPYIDVGDIHDYDYDYQMSRQIESPHFSGAQQVLASLGKAIIVGETGINSGFQEDCPTSVNRRAIDMRRKFDTYLSKGTSAVLVWNLARNARQCGFTFDPRDPLFRTIIEYQPAVTH